MTAKTNWEPTRKGGFRRQPQAGVAQLRMKDEATDLSDNATFGAAASGVETDTEVVNSGERLQEPDQLQHTKEVGGSNPSPGTSFKFYWREKLGLDSCPYLIRWRLETPWCSVRLHHWLSHDDPRHVHDHPWNFITFVLKGGYVDVSPCRACGGRGHDAVANGVFPCTDCVGIGEVKHHLRAPAVQYRDATHQHTVYPDEGGCWTVIFTGPKIREWGFWVNGKFKSRIKYFWKFGHHPCD